jgi:UDP-arabinose 4-epimerase
MSAILVTGGAGYVGAHVCKALRAEGFLPVTLDDLSSGSARAVRWGPLVEADIADATAVTALVAEYRIQAAMHFAGAIEAGLSVLEPARFHRVNVDGSRILIDALLGAGVTAFVFSSSAAVYGEPTAVPIPESHPLAPVNPYGHTKLLVERMLEDLGRERGLKWAALRYFNAAGADPQAEIGEAHRPETHLIPLAIASALGMGPALKLFGTDYPTPDGTAIRDYVHVSDLAAAHVAALRRLLAGNPPLVANLGTGTGHSVRAIIDAVGKEAGRPPQVETIGRRPGDPAILVADPGLALRELNWRPVHSDLAEIVASAIRWHRSNGARD